MTGEQLLKLQEKISADNVDSFYHWKDWEQLRAEVLRMDNHECQICKQKGRYRRADIVHHVKHLKDRPTLRYLSGMERSGSLSVYAGSAMRTYIRRGRCDTDTERL